MGDDGPELWRGAVEDKRDLLAGRYLVGDVLGSGGAARVHRAWDTRLGRPVAVKTFRGEPDAVELRRFDNEGHTLATLSHPVLVEVYDAGVDGRRPFLVLQLIEGHTLRQRIAQGPLSTAETARLGVRLAEALAYVHERGIVHRDVKPSNVLIDGDGLAYLADFGVARLTGARQLTASNEMIGTAAYLAPEQVRGGEVDTAVDVYALGLVLLECITGLVEYDGGDVESAIARLHRPPAVPEHLPDGLALLLSRMTSLNPRRRPTAREVADALADVPGETDILPWADEPVAPRRRPLAVVGLGLVAVAGIVAWGVSGTATSPDPQTAIPAPTTTEPTVPTTTPTTTPLVKAVQTKPAKPKPTTATAKPAPETVVVAEGKSGKGKGRGGKPPNAGKPRR